MAFCELAFGPFQPNQSDYREVTVSQSLAAESVLRTKVILDKQSPCSVHAASPFFYESEEILKELLEPAVLGTRNVLSAVAKNKSTIKATVVRILP